MIFFLCPTRLPAEFENQYDNESDEYNDIIDVQ